MASRNYVYGLQAPTQGRERVLEQLVGANRYRNKLVQIELLRREQTDSTIRQHVPGLLECEGELADVSAQIDVTLAAQRERNRQARGLTDDSDTKQRVADLKSRRKDLVARRKAMRSNGFLSLGCQAALSAVNDSAAAAVRAARAACGLYWGTYLLVEQAADSFRKGAPPVYRGYRGEGTVGVQLQGGLSWEDATSGRDTRLRIQHTPQACEAYSQRGKPLPIPGARRRAKQYTLWLRVGSDGREPIWATWPLILHRPIPAAARIKWAMVQRRIVAGKERWQLILSIEGEPQDFAKPVAVDGIVGIDVGYRVLPDGRLRVAFTHGSDGAGRELCIPAGTMKEFAKIEDLQSIRDQRHNEARAALREWLDCHDAPQWLREEAATMHVWRRLFRLAVLVRQWSDQRFDGDEEVLAVLQGWRKKEQHLWQYQEQLRDQLIAWRKDYYRRFAAEIRRRYATVVIERLDLRELHDVLRPPEDRELYAPQRRAARTANLSLLIQCLRESGCEVVAVDPANTTATCHDCGGLCDWDQASQLRHACEHCGVEWDQDANAARNILARGRVAVQSRQSLADDVAQGVTTAAASTKKVSRSQRLQAARKRNPETV